MTLNRAVWQCAIVAGLVLALASGAHAQAPTVTSVDPNRGPSSGGTFVLITGTNFIGTTQVRFGDVATTDFFVLDGAKIRAVTPENIAGRVNVSVTNASGTGTLNEGFLYLAVPTTRADNYETPFNVPLNVPAPGVLANDDSNGGGPMTAGIWTGATNGGVSLSADGSFTYTPITGFSGTDSFTYRASNNNGTSNVTTVTITVAGRQGAQTPTGLVVWSIDGNMVTLRWTAPVGGLTPTRYAVECGLNPGEVAQSFPTADATTVLSFIAPSGSVYCRVLTVSVSERSAASNEVRIFVNTTSVAPSAPAHLAALVNAASLALSWRNTYAGGTPASLVLDVAGATAASILLPIGESFVFSGVPAGTYTLSLRAVNAAGSSAPSNAVTVAFPGACSGAPPVPPNFLAYRIGNTIYVVWDSSPAGTPAATGYVLHVSGALTGSVPTTGRMMSGTVGAGSYNFSVVATNSCGSSAPTAVQTVTIP